MSKKSLQKLFDEYKSLVDDGYIIEVEDAEKAIIDKIYNDATRHIRAAIDSVHPVGNNEVICKKFRKAIELTIKQADGQGENDD